MPGELIFGARPLPLRQLRAQLGGGWSMLADDPAGAQSDSEGTPELSSYAGDPRLDQFCCFLLILVLLETAAVLIFGWGFGIDIWRRFDSSFAAMVPSTAVSIMLVAGGLALACSTLGRSARRGSIRVAALLSFAVAATNLAVILGGYRNGIDQLLWPRTAIFEQEGMSPAASLGLLFGAICMLLAPARHKHPQLFSTLATIGFLLAAVAVNAYVFGATSLYHVGIFSTYSLPTALALGATFGVILVRYGDVGWVSNLLAKGQGGRAARSLIPAVVGIPLIFSIIANHLNNTGTVSVHFLFSLMSVATTCLLAIIVLTATKRVEEAEQDALHAMSVVREARDRAKAAELAKANFLANMSHELRTPMNAVLGFTELLLKSDLTQEQRQQLGLISESGSSMMSLLDSILDLSKIESGKAKIEHEPFDIRNTLSRSVRFLRGAALQKGLDLRLAIDDEIPQFILGDKLRVLQILTNLIGNAIKFTPAGWVKVSASVSTSGGKQVLEISVADTGIGIAPDQHEEVFGEFVQADNSISRRFGGTGLGLSICRRLTELLQGSIRFESRLGKGTTFYVTLPLEKAQPNQVKSIERGKPDGTATAGKAKDARILVAEDHDINRKLIASQLDGLGYRYDVVNDGDLAIAKVKEMAAKGEQYSLILMDVQMPDVDGLEATRIIRDCGYDSETLPIIAITAHAFEEDVRNCLQAGMQDHIAKPLRIDVLREKLQQWLPSGPSASPSTVDGAQDEDAAKALRGRYLAFKREVSQLLEECLEAMPEADPARLDELKQQLHKLAGNAALFEEAAIGEIALELEEKLDAPAAERDENEIEALMRRFLEEDRRAD